MQGNWDAARANIKETDGERREDEGSARHGSTEESGRGADRYLMPLSRSH